MKANQSSARLTFRNFIKAGAFVLLVVVLGAGMAVVAGLFVLGDLSGAWQTEKVAAGHAPGQKLISARFVEPAATTLNPLRAVASTNRSTDTVPPPLVAASGNENSAEVPVARAIPVLPDVPVLRARPVLMTAPRTFDARAEVAGDQFIPRARPVSSRELNGASGQPYELPASRNVAQRGPVALNW
jgi:hypothetical protein